MARNPNTRDDVARPQDAKPRVRRADDQICLGQRNDAAPSNHASPQKTGRQPSALFSSQKSQAVKPFLVCCCPLASFVCSQIDLNLRLSTRFISKKKQAREEQQLQQENKEGKAAAAKAASALMTHRPEFSASSRSSKYSSSSSKCRAAMQQQQMYPP